VTSPCHKPVYGSNGAAAPPFFPKYLLHLACSQLLLTNGLFQIKSDALLHSEALVLCASRDGGLPLHDRFAFIRAGLAIAIQFNDEAAQGRALMAAAAAQMDALEHSVFAVEDASAGVDVPDFCCLPASAGDAVSCSCAAAALCCNAFHNARCAAFYEASNGAGVQDLQAEYAEAVVLASLAFKEAGAYVSARTCAARAMDMCEEIVKLQMKARASHTQTWDSEHSYILQKSNLKRFKFYCCCQLLHVTAASVFAHACLLQDCNSPADAALQFEFCAAIFSFLDQTSLHVACVLRAVECKRVVVGMAVRIAAAPARVIVMCCAACLLTRPLVAHVWHAVQRSVTACRAGHAQAYDWPRAAALLQEGEAIVDRQPGQVFQLAAHAHACHQQ
jgi:hypothetical protein